MLAGREAAAVVATTNAGRARLFYGSTLALPFVEDDAGVWTAPDATRIARFSDPDGNVLALRQDARA